jgi:hypothetical protein
VVGWFKFRLGRDVSVVTVWVGGGAAGAGKEGTG